MGKIDQKRNLKLVYQKCEKLEQYLQVMCSVDRDTSAQFIQNKLEKA